MNQGDVVAIGLVNLRGIPLAETVSADARKPQIITHDFQLLLDGSLADWKEQVPTADAIPQAIVFDVLLDDKRNCEDPLFPCLLLHDLQAVILLSLCVVGVCGFVAILAKTTVGLLEILFACSLPVAIILIVLAPGLLCVMCELILFVGAIKFIKKIFV